MVSDLKFISVVKAEVINFTSVYKSSKQHNKVRTTVRNGNVSGKKGIGKYNCIYKMGTLCFNLDIMEKGVILW